MVAQEETLGTPISTTTYHYGNGNFMDLLTGITRDGVYYAISSDAIGNTLSDGTRTYTWRNGRELATLTQDGRTWTNTYNADGLRTKRTDGTTTYTYTYNGSQLTYMTVGNNTLHFTYDVSGSPMLLTYNGVEYYYATNLQGDVIAIIDADGYPVVTYHYDPWGEVLSIGDSMASTLGVHNPLLYRGYVYDHETCLYYLQSRYYNPDLRRFINADAFASTGQGFIGCNQFSYCANNPVNRIDATGMFWKEVGQFFTNVWKGVENFVKNTFGAGSTTSVSHNHKTPIIPDPLPITLYTGTENTRTVSEQGNSSKPISVYTDKDILHPIMSSSAGLRINQSNSSTNLNLALDDISLMQSSTYNNKTYSLGVKVNLAQFKVGVQFATADQRGDTTHTNYTNLSINFWTIIMIYQYVKTGQFVPAPTYN